MPFSHDFLTEIARPKKLTDLEIAVFLLLFGQDKNKVQIANELDTTETVVSTRLTGVYKKFGINEPGPVKERELRRYLEEQQKRKPVTSLSDMPLESVKDPVDALVQQVRSRLHDDIQRLHGTMPLWGVDRWVPLGDLFVDVNILEKLSSSDKSEYDDLCQDFMNNPSHRGLDRIGLGKEQKRVPGLEVLAKNTSLMVVGKPGSGKTTYLQRVVTECNAGNLQAHRIPVLIRLRDFVEDGREVPYSLEPYLEGCWRLSDAETKLIFDRGRALVLLDGLDEVAGEDGKNIAKEIKRFARSYPQVQVIVTCRTQSFTGEMDWKSLRFQFVEVANFNKTQVQLFSEHWFKTVMGDESGGLAKAREFLEQLFLEANKPIQDLTITPILLSLTCAVFHQTGKFYSKRSKLYEEGLELLLEKWDERRGIERDKIYRDLSVERKLELLSFLAVKKFEKEQYVLFEQAEIEGYIAEFLGIGQRDSGVVLKAMEKQHGLLIERAQKVWSFSHLTFQEYLVAKWFCDRADCQGLANHITEKRWWEVFLLVTGMMDLADDLVQLMKKNIDLLLVKHNKVQKFLAWVNHKTCSVKNTYNPAKRLPRVHFREDCQDIECKKAAIRAFYYELALAPNHNHNLAVSLYRNLISKFSNNFGLHGEPEHRLSSEFELCGVIEHGLAPYLHFASDLAIVGADDLAIDAALDSNLDYVCGRIDKLELLELIKEISQLKNQIPPKAQGINIFEEWWKLNGKNWTEQLRSIMLKFRNIGHNWDLEPEEIELLEKYYNANKLLVDCLNSGCSVNNEVREAIEDTLLLPIAEIEKRKREKAE